MTVLQEAKKQVAEILKTKISEPVYELIKPIPLEIGKYGLTIPLFKFAKKNPQEFAKELANEFSKNNLNNTLFSAIEAKNGYLNFIYNNQEFSKFLINDFKNFNSKKISKIGENQTVIIDYSSPNIAKPFSIGHLRSTIIGATIYNILKVSGYKLIGDNHIGDWGTQFGKLIVAYKTWGDRTKIEQNPIKELLDLYVKFHQQVKVDPELEDEARKWFKKLENGDEEATNIWQWITNVSLNEFENVYDTLDVNFDKTLGESFYKDKTNEIIEICQKKGLAKWEPALDKNNEPSKTDKVLLINLEKYGIKTPLLLQKSDGTTLYATRDLAAIKYRLETWHPKKIIYVVGSEQELYFKQIFKVAELLGWNCQYEHIKFGLISLPEGKMSTRSGRVIFLEDVLNESIEKVKKIIKNRDMNESEQEEIAKIVGIGAIKYADLSQNKIHNIKFDWNTILNLKGNSGPYLQYQAIRIKSILDKADFNKEDQIKPELLTKKEEIKLINTIASFSDLIEEISIYYQIHDLANYLYTLANEFSKFYEKCPVIKAESKDLKNSRLYLCYITSVILTSGLDILGINVPEKM